MYKKLQYTKKCFLMRDSMDTNCLGYNNSGKTILIKYHVSHKKSTLGFIFKYKYYISSIGNMENSI